jgi:hypothetical protein
MISEIQVDYQLSTVHGSKEELNFVFIKDEADIIDFIEVKMISKLADRSSYEKFVIQNNSDEQVVLLDTGLFDLVYRSEKVTLEILVHSNGIVTSLPNRKELLLYASV